MEKLKNNLFTIVASACLSVALLFAGLAGYSLKQTTPEPEQNLGVREILKVYHNVATSTTALLATTTAFNMTPTTATVTPQTIATGTSPFVFDASQARSIDMNVFGFASSSLANVTIKAQGSQNYIDWYDLACSNCNKQISLATSTNGIASNYLLTNYTLTSIAQKFVRILYSPSSATTSDNGNFQIYIQAVLKNNSGAD